MEEEDLHMECEARREGTHPVSPVSWRGFDPVKQIVSKCARSPNMRPTAMQNLLFLSKQWPKPSPVLIAPTHRGMARLSGLENMQSIAFALIIRIFFQSDQCLNAYLCII